MSNSEGQADMTFTDHLEVLRWHIIRSVIAVLAFTIIAFLNNGFVIDTLLFGPTNPEFITYKWLCDLSALVGSEALCITDLPIPKDLFVNLKMTGQFTMHITISIVAGVICAFPYIFWEFWRFLKPALYAGEKTATRGTVFIVSCLFFTGVLFGYYIICPLTYNFFVHYEATANMKNQFSFSSYFGVMGNLVLVCGLMFQLPVAVYFMAKIGIVTAKGMIEKRKIAFVVILFIAAIFTPADVISQLLVAFPLFLLYQISIMVARIVGRKRAKSLR